MNRTDFERAVALHYDREGAPTVLASGEGEIARLIKERADAAGVPLVEDPKLSYLLSKIPLGDEIPPTNCGNDMPLVRIGSSPTFPPQFLIRRPS